MHDVFYAQHIAPNSEDIDQHIQLMYVYVVRGIYKSNIDSHSKSFKSKEKGHHVRFKSRCLLAHCCVYKTTKCQNPRSDSPRWSAIRQSAALDGVWRGSPVISSPCQTTTMISDEDGTPAASSPSRPAAPL